MHSSDCCEHSSPRPQGPDLPHATYTCPMDPEVRQIGPGSCPKCGMALEPVIASLKSLDETDPELIEMTRRFWISAIFSVPLLLISLSDLLPNPWIETLKASQILAWTQLALASPAVLWAGAPLFKKGFQSVKNQSFNMFTLIAMGTGISYGSSVVFVILSAFFPGLLPSAFLNHSGQVGVYFEPAAVITTLVLLGQVLELRARGQSRVAIRSLLQLAPKTARLVRPDGTELDVTADSLRVGDQVRVRPGEKIPVDGKLKSGQATVDESMISGEAIPIEKLPGYSVTAGTLNRSGSFILEATRVGEETLLAQMVRLVTQAQRTRAPIQRVADQVSSFFVPAVILVAALTFIVWILWGPEPRFTFALMNSVAVLIIACPCALGLAAPMSILVATGAGARNGILIKTAEALETLETIDTWVVDKTGTLTEGRPKLTSVVSISELTPTQILEYAAALEKGSEHPLASAISQGAMDHGIKELPPTENFKSITGLGLTAQIHGREVALGNIHLLHALRCDESKLEAQASQLRADGQTVVYLAIDRKPAGILGVIDPIKATTAEAIQNLKKEGIRLILVTGDHKITAESVAKKLGITEVKAEVLPEGKIALIRELQSQGHRVAMAGDGVNDAPALAQAQVGIAMGNGTDIAIESAGIALIQGDLRGIVRAKQLSHATLKNIRQNLFFAFAYNLIGVPVAAGVLYPVFGILLNPMIASAAMSVSSISVIGNSLRLSRALKS